MHAGESGVYLPVGVEMEAYGNLAAAASNQLSASLGNSHAGNPAVINIEWCNWQSPTDLQ